MSQGFLFKMVSHCTKWTIKKIYIHTTAFAENTNPLHLPQILFTSYSFEFMCSWCNIATTASPLHTNIQVPNF